MRMDSIPKLLHFSWRNLWRRSSRTFLLGISLFLMAALAVVFFGMTKGLSKQMVSGAIDNFLGERVYFSDKSKEDVLWPELLVDFDSSRLLEKISGQKDLEASKQYRAKIFCYSSTNQQGLLLIGIEEDKLSRKLNLVSGEFPQNGENDILLTASVAKKCRFQSGIWFRSKSLLRTASGTLTGFL
jgi:hypothetical protein